MGDWTWDQGFDKAKARRARENQHVDEFGIEKPAVPWTQRLTDYMLPSEAIQSKDNASHWYSSIPRSFGACAAGFLGHFMDALSPFDTRGDFHVTGPILGELAHSDKEAEYHRKRASYKKALRSAGSSAEAALESNEPNFTPADSHPSDREACELFKGMY